MSSHKLKPFDYSRTLVTTMKDECPYILEWLSHHFSIGFTHAIVLTNDCTDSTEKLLRKLEAEGLVTQKNNPAPHPRGPQKNGYLRMRRLEAFQQAEWLMALDVDEFLRIDVGDGTLDDLFKTIGPNISAISFVWQLFGNNNIRDILDAPLTQQFTLAAHPLQARPYETLPFKTLYKNGFFAKIGTHRPNDFDTARIEEFDWIDADGVSLKNFTRVRHWTSHASGLGFGTALGRINHYALRSIKGFANKWERGFVHPDAPTVRGKGTAFDYWQLFNWNDCQETGIQKHHIATQEMTSRLKDIKRVKHFHELGFEIHVEKANAFAHAHPEFFEKIDVLGSSQITDNLPDFSKHGCPPIGKQHYVNTDRLNHKLTQSLLPKDVISKINYQIGTS